MKKTILLRLLAVTLVLCMLAPVALAATIHMTFTGDVTLGSERKKRNQPTSFHTAVAEKGYDYFFQNWVDMFAADDLTVVNLEGPLTDSDKEEHKSKTYRFNGPTDFVKILLAGSVEACNISNNHTADDFGKQGFQSTKDTLDAAGIGWFATRTSWIFEKDGIRIGFLGFNSTKFHGSVEWIPEEIRLMKEQQGVNAVVFVYHGGAEYGRSHTSTQRNVAHAVIDAGADLVIMHHPHVVQGMEVYKNRTICYSLGNFCFGGNKEVRELDTVVAGVTMDFDDQGVYTGQQVTLYPAHISTDEKQNTFQPIRVTGDDAQQVMQKIQKDTDFELAPYTDEAGCAVQAYVPANAAE